MPMRITVSHFERPRVGVGSGDLTLQDLEIFFREIVEGKMIGYRKIVDITAYNPVVTPAELSGFGTVVREAHRGRPPMPLAIAAHARQSPIAAEFAKLTADVRLAQVFNSIHDARKWIHENSARPS